MDNRQAHNRYQRALFRDEIDNFRESTPREVVPRLKQIVELAHLERSDRVLDVGTGTGVLIPYIRRYGVRKIVGCDLSSMMLKEAKKQHPDVLFWCGDVVNMPDTQGSFDAVFLNAMFGNVWDQWETLQKVATLLAARGRIYISHPLGSRFVADLHEKDPRRTPHLLPDIHCLRELTATLGLKILYCKDFTEFYAVGLQRG